MTDHELFQIRPIGTIESPYKQKFGTPRQSQLNQETTGKIIFDKEVMPDGSLDGLEEYSHLWVLFIFHKNNLRNQAGKVKPPRLEGKKMGVLATRSPHHPNDIGMSLVKILKIDQQSKLIEFSSVDMIDQTPVIDIKPYINEYDSVDNSKSPWLEIETFKIEFTEKVEELLSKREDHLKIKQLITSSFQFDVRNHEDRTNNLPDKVHKSLIKGLDIHFKYDGTKVLITDCIDIS